MVIKHFMKNYFVRIEIKCRGLTIWGACRQGFVEEMELGGDVAAGDVAGELPRAYARAASPCCSQPLREVLRASRPALAPSPHSRSRHTARAAHRWSHSCRVAPSQQSRHCLALTRLPHTRVSSVPI